MASGAASVNHGASQPGTTSSGAASFSLGSFNFGMQQTMMQSTKPQTIHKDCVNFGRVRAKIVEEGHLDILFGPEVGGPGGGFRRQLIDVSDVLSKPFGVDISVSEVDNYIAVCEFPCPPHVSLNGFPEKFRPPVGNDVDARSLTFVQVVLLSLPSTLSLGTSILFVLAVRLRSARDSA